MKKSRYILITILLCISAFSLVMQTACKKNDCGNTSCQNGGVCQGDTCVCPTGFVGNDCGTLWSTQYLGTYSCTQTCSPSVGAATWTSVISGNSVSGQDTIVISNFGNLSHSVVAGVDNKGNIYILANNNTGTIGSGTLSNGVLSLKYTTLVSGGSGGYICTMTMTKQ